jgi:hypothetical protein
MGIYMNDKANNRIIKNNSGIMMRNGRKIVVLIGSAITGK